MTVTICQQNKPKSVPYTPQKPPVRTVSFILLDPCRTALTTRRFLSHNRNNQAFHSFALIETEAVLVREAEHDEDEESHVAAAADNRTK